MHLDTEAVELEWSGKQPSCFKCRVAPEARSLGGYTSEVEVLDDSIQLHFEEGFTLELRFSDQTSLSSFAKALQDNVEEDQGPKEAGDPQLAFQFRITVVRERALARLREAELRQRFIDLDRRLWRRRLDLLAAGFDCWRAVAAASVQELLRRDKLRWCLHAKASEDLDLQAWYNFLPVLLVRHFHALNRYHDSFHNEIFGLKVRFWLRDSVLPVYRLSNKLIANKLTKYEESALAHVLCTPDTTYGDVASHMFVIQSLVRPELFALFEQICSKGVTVVKFPRSGAPAKKLFRFSFVEGSIYFTWKGQYGNQGVDLGEVDRVDVGMSTELLCRSGRKDKESLYLSLVCAERSVDLQCASPEEREDLRQVLAALVAKEKDAAGAKSI